jgi:hypothetical protein
MNKHPYTGVSGSSRARLSKRPQLSSPSSWGRCLCKPRRQASRSQTFEAKKRKRHEKGCVRRRVALSPEARLCTAFAHLPPAQGKAVRPCFPKIRIVNSDAQEALLVKTDRDVMIEAVEQAQRILAEHLEPGALRSSVGTIHRLVTVLERPEVLAAMERMKASRGLRLVK